jgi:hypothetical protein
MEIIVKVGNLLLILYQAKKCERKQRIYKVHGDIMSWFMRAERY